MSKSLLEETLRLATKDQQMVTPEGKPIEQPFEGVRIRESQTHTDARGTVFELYDTRWNYHPDPLVFSYCFTIRPGMVKGWNLHRLHEDRYCVLFGELELVLYDVRPQSPTCGKIYKMVSSQYHRSIITVPKDVWHADHNIGATDAIVVNFPTMAYQHEQPDKYRLPLDTPLIPYKFECAKGGW
jgi:dTDP-4-dehydrorhamnose 3,5-epimerase